MCPLLLGLTLASPASAQILVRNGGIPSPNTPQLGADLRFFEADELQESRLTTRLAWSFEGRTGFEIEVPLVQRDATFGASTDDATALGDVELRVQRSLFQADDVLASTRWAVFADLRLPTGDDDALRGPNGPFPRLLQPGMGSLGIGAGAVWTRIRDRHRFSAELHALWNDEDGGFQMGTEIHAGLSYWYRLRPATFDAEHHVTEVRPVLELLLTQRFESERDGRGTGDEGALGWVAPGVQVFPREDLLVQASVALPFINEIDDVLGRRDWAALLSFRFYF